MNASNYICCFCGELIKANKFDVTNLIATLNWDKEISKQQTQQFFCHLMCFKSKLHKKVPLYLLDLIDEEDSA